MHVVYGLQDPRNNEVFYVGMTSDVYARFIQHIRCEGTNEAKNEWIYQLKALGLLPIPHTLETVHTLKYARERELYWITHYAYLGMPLTNELLPDEIRAIKKVIGSRCTLDVSDKAVSVVSFDGSHTAVISAREWRIVEGWRKGLGIKAIISSEYTNSNGEPLIGGNIFTQKSKEIQTFISRFLPSSTTPTLTPQEWRILEKWQQGLGMKAIIASEFTNGKGEPLAGGDLFTQKSREIQMLISQFLPRKEA